MRHISGQSAMIGLVCMLFSLAIAKDDLFRAYNCENPMDSHFISHKECHRSVDAIENESFSILQKKSASNLDAFACSGFLTIETDYCGAYSHTKVELLCKFNFQS